MNTLAIVGSQWGDEGKGKITDLLGQKVDLVVRFQGGNNAGHTIIVGKQKVILHLIPSGILHDTCQSVVTHGVVFDPTSFKTELEEVQSSGIKVTPEKLRISENCSVITSYHKIIDGQRESKGKTFIGTTGKGIGPTYEDKVGRRSLKLKDLLNKETIEKKLQESILEKEVLFKNFYQCEYPSVKEEAENLFELGKLIAPFLTDTFSLLDKAFETDKKILFEGAQGVLLDVDYGSYPFVTSSNTALGGIFTGAGVPLSKDMQVLGITKAYTTRVGEGPFPTELHTELGEKIQQKGGEFGATTGRKRRCGWLDLPLLKYSVKCSNITSIALTKLDVLSEIEELKVCTSYKYRGEEIYCAYPGIDMFEAEPVYTDFKPFNDDFKTGDLSPELNTYIKAIEDFVGIPVGIVAYGPERSEIHFRSDYF